MNSYISLGITALFPVILSAILFACNKFFVKDKKSYWIFQIVAGILFGGVAIVATEWGIPINGAMVNVRDAAPICAGLFFGAPAGIIAGVLGGVERWIAVAWGVGSYTRVACTVSTILAGVYAALLRVYMFDNKKPSWALSFAVGLVMEVFHLTMVFVTNFDTASKAALVVKTCTAPMLVANSVSVMLASMIIGVMSADGIAVFNKKTQITDIIQRWLLVAVMIAFLITSLFMYVLQYNLTLTQRNNLLSYGIEDMKAAVRNAVDERILATTKEITQQYKTGNYTLKQLMLLYYVSEINIVDNDGIIIDSTNSDYIGFDFRSGEQSREFLCLNQDKYNYVQAYGPISYDSEVFMKYGGVSLGNGFIQVGYNTSQFHSGLQTTVMASAGNRRIGENGYCLITNANGSIVSAPDNFPVISISKTKLNDDINSAELGSVFKDVFNGEECYFMVDQSEGYNTIAVYPVSEANESLEIAMFTNTFLEILVFAIVFGMIYFLIKFVIVDKMRKVNDSLAQITGGNLNVSVNVRSTEEFASLSDDINNTVDTLKHYIDEAAARIDKELEFAKSIQSSALPNVFPAFPHRKDFDIYARMDTAKEVGGDFYDFYISHKDTLNFLIADVSGKGIPAALFMMRAKTQLKSLTESGLAINDVFTRGNAGLCEGNDANMFVTAWQGQMNLDTGKLLFANAGHNQPLVKHVGGKFEYLQTRPGFVLAGMDGVKFRMQELQLEHGDIVFLYTDGVTEATDANNELYGEERLQNILNSREFTDMKDLCDTVKADVDLFVAEAPQFDDITMLGFKFIGTNARKVLEYEHCAIDNIPEITEIVEAELERMACPMKHTMTIDVAIDELYSNIAQYSYEGRENGPATVIIEELADPHGVSIKFIDEGMPYNPLKKEDPNTSLSLEERGIGGLGIYMVKKSMDSMTYEYKDDKNIVTIQKYF